MFKKLKEKITDEVKNSPQRFQQLTQTVTDKLQTSTTSNENFFSIGDDDANMSSANNDQGFSSVSLVSPTESKIRRNSNSSMASDVSFLPRYEAGNVYHLQSDLDDSISELEDNVSTASSQLGHLSKEQIYSAFQKSQMKYHKYRGRYTDLTRHYKELERENAKMKSVLVETQDKAIRRVTELKEQCSLEQKAKAHLEAALRDELDEKQMKIQSLQTKIGLVQQENSSSETQTDLDKKDAVNNIDSEKLEQLTTYLNEARTEIEALNSRVQEYKATTIVYQSKEQEYKSKIANLEKEIARFSEREKENNIKLAENKMELHNELLSKDSEISRLKKDIENLKANINTIEKEGKSSKLENLQSQNNKLIEKLENLTQKCNGLENELLKVEKYKMEISELNERNLELNKALDESKNLQGRINVVLEENSQLQTFIDNLKLGISNCQENFKKLADEKTNLIETIGREKTEYEKQIESLRESAKKGLFTLEKQILERVRKSYEDREESLKEEFRHKLKDISLDNKTVNELHLQLVEKDSLIKKNSEELQNIQEVLVQMDNKYKELEINHLELIEESNMLRNTVAVLEKQVADVGKENTEAYEDKITRLQANIKTLQEKLGQLENICENKEQNNVQLTKDILKLENTCTELLQQVRLTEERKEVVELENTESNLLEMKVQALEQEKISLLDSFEMERNMFNEILKENKELRVKEVKIGELEERNRNLEEKVLRLKGFLKNKEDSIVKLNKIKLGLEENVTKLKETVRIIEEKEEAVEIDKTECNLLQIKIQQLENEKNNLIKSLERESFDPTFFNQKSEEFEKHKEEIMNENVLLAKDNIELKKINEELLKKVRIIEERDQVAELETTECNLLKLKVQELEKERDELLRGFEVEREMFNTILVEHKELKLKEEHIKGLESSNKHLTEKVAELKGYLRKKEEVIVELQKTKLHLEETVIKLKESVRIYEEKSEIVEINEAEYGLLEMKLRALEEEKQGLLESFEVERKTFERALNKSGRIEVRIEELSQENLILKEEKEKINNNLKEKSEQHKESLGKISSLSKEICKLEKENEDLKKDLGDREQQIKELSKTTSKLSNDIEKQSKEFNRLLDRSKQLEIILEKIQAERNESLNKQNEMRERMEEVQKELDKKNMELNDMRKALEDVEQLSASEKDIQLKEVESLKVVVNEQREKLNQLDNDKDRLEKDLKKKNDEYSFKAKELSVIEQQLGVLQQDKESLIQESRQLREKIGELTQECTSLRNLVPKVKKLDQIKRQNEALQRECDKLNQEISELKVRISQLSSDNRNITEEHERLITEVEEQKAKNELLENEKGQFEGIRSKWEHEKETLEVSVDELNEKLQQSYRDLENISRHSRDDLNLAKIQQDFFDIKEKCDSLYVENKNLKAEYIKLEEQCNKFSEIKNDLDSQMSELERHYNEVLHEKQLLQDEVHELKISPINASRTSSGKLDDLAIVKQERELLSALPNMPDIERLRSEIENLRDKLTQYKSLDITNKSSIEFYENELQKMKNKNEKLNRKLDETLVTLNHCTELSSSTEIEYLRNVLYNYMLGKESLVLARVIAAVCKFDPSQTEAVLQKEQQKQTLLGQLGLL